MGDSEESSSESLPVDFVFSVHSVASSVDPPMDKWSSLEVIVPEENKKKILCDAGLYEPGSGEICTKHIALSTSSMFRHPYYNYPAILDPGIEVALLGPEPRITYPDDGQALYLALCKEMNQCPIGIFYRGLHDFEIDLRYYGINPNGFRAIAKALQYNNTVEKLNLTDNFLNEDACYHMGDMLLSNKAITEINLRGCRIGHEGARRLLANLPLNGTLQVLDLSYNKLGDESMPHLANAIIYGITVKKLNLSYNNISGKGVACLVEAFETHNDLTHLDLSWNKLYSLGGHTFLTKLSENTCLEVLNLSWNSLSGPRMGLAIGQVLLCPLLRKLYLSNNQLEGEAIMSITENLTKAKKLNTLDLSYNPLTPRDAVIVMHQVAMNASKVKNVIMDNVFVDPKFLTLLENAKGKESKKDLVVTYGGVVGVFKAKGPDPREVVLNRVEHIIKAKKSKADMALIILQLKKDGVIVLNSKDLSTILEADGVYLDEDLVDELCIAFPAPSKSAKVKVININLLAEYGLRRWPGKKLPPTPPPEPEPEVTIPAPEPQKKKKGKGKKK